MPVGAGISVSVGRGRAVGASSGMAVAGSSVEVAGAAGAVGLRITAMAGAVAVGNPALEPGSSCEGLPGDSIASPVKNTPTTITTANPPTNSTP